MQCPRCHATTAPGGKFCSACGQRLEPAGVRRSGTSPSPRPALDDERKQVTVLFADMQSSMELVAEQDPEEARAALDPILERMIDAVRRYGGTVNQVMGDGIMALFGAPRALEDHAVRACHAALLIQASLHDFSGTTNGGARLPIRVRIGLNSGEVVVRSIGSDLQMDYTAVGQTTHLAARMEQLAPPGSIFITGAVLRLAQGAVQVRPMGLMTVKGLEKPIEIYEVVGGAPHGWHGGRPARTPFVGRVREMDRLRALAVSTVRGHGAVATIAGDAGIGKTRLCDELLQSVAGEGWTILHMSALSYREGTPYLPLIDLLRRYFELDTADSAERVQRRLSARLADLGSERARVLAPLLALLEALPPDDEFLALDPAHRRERTMEALERVLLHEAEHQPVLLLVDNLQWIDTETEAFVTRLGTRVAGARLLVLCTHRAEHTPSLVTDPEGATVRLESLGAGEAGQLLDEMLGRDASLEPLKARLLEVSGRNPFFLEASVQALVEANVLLGAAGAYRLGAPADTITVPATVQAVISARIDRLPPARKHLLQAAAVIGTKVPVRVLRSVVDQPERTVRGHLRHLLATGFLRPLRSGADAEHTFGHILEHEVAYASVLRARRRALHARVVEVLEAQAADGVPVEPDHLAHHAVKAELWAKAARYHREAGGRAMRRCANHEAVSHFRAALHNVARLPDSRETVEQSVELRLELRAPLLQLGRLDEALMLTQEAETLARRLGDERVLARVYTYLVNYHYMKGEPELALAYGHRCLATADACADPDLQTLARQYIGQSLHARGRYREALALLEQNIEGFEPARESASTKTTVRYTASCAWAAWAAAEVGHFDQAEAYVAAAQRAADASEHPYAQVIAWTLTGLVALYRGRTEVALLPLARTVEACQGAQLAIWQPIPWSLLGLTLVRLGCVSEGVSLLERALVRSDELGIRVYQSLWTARLAEGLEVAGRLDEARRAATLALERALTHDEQGHHALALGISGRIAAASAKPDEATQQLQAALALASQREMQPLVATCHDDLARLHQRAGDPESAAPHARAAEALRQELGIQREAAPASGAAADPHYVIVVAQERGQLHELLTRELASAPNVRVVVDRRRPERRPRGTARDDEQRRHLDLEPLSTWGLAVLRQEGPASPGAAGSAPADRGAVRDD